MLSSPLNFVPHTTEHLQYPDPDVLEHAKGSPGPGRLDGLDLLFGLACPAHHGPARFDPLLCLGPQLLQLLLYLSGVTAYVRYLRPGVEEGLREPLRAALL